MLIYLLATAVSLLAVQPAMQETVEAFFGDGGGRVPPGTNLHDRLADLLLTALAFAAEDPGAALPAGADGDGNVDPVDLHCKSRFNPLPLRTSNMSMLERHALLDIV